MNPGDLVRLAGHHARAEEHGGSVGVIVAKHWNSLGTACRLEVAIGGDLMSVHPAWVEIITEGCDRAPWDQQ